MNRCTIVSLLLAGIVSAAPLVPSRRPPTPHFDRLYPNERIIDFLKGYAAAYPKFVKLESIGKTVGGNDTWLVTIQNPGTGPELSKPAMYIDGATHANEVQGTETVLYVMDYLLKQYGRLPKVTKLLDRAVFYFVPIVNPDNREAWFKKPATPHFPRTLLVPIDDDRDGLADEDGYDDLDGNGEITQMRKKVPLGEGTHRLDPNDPRILLPADVDHQGNYIMLGEEGFDNDGDGRVNEDTIGYVDPNRTWGYEWQPRYVQSGAPDYPFQTPATRNIALFALKKPNIAAGQSFHNSGRMILRGPGSKSQPRYPKEDETVFDIIGEEGEKILPGYRYYVTWKDLYTAYATTDDHFYGTMGAIFFTNELYSEEQDFDGDGKVSEEELLKFNDRIAIGRMFVPWRKVKHPQYGEIEVGGFRHDTLRVPEGWMLEQECHRNAAFVLFHASELPLLTFGKASVKTIRPGLYEVMLPVRNERAIPSMTGIAKKLHLHRPDLVTVKGAKVVAAGTVENPWLREIRIQKHRPERLLVDGIRGLSHRTIYLLLEGTGNTTITYDSLKGGRHRISIPLP